jgi:cyclin-dependent kinase-like
MTDYVATRWYRSPELLLSYTIYGKEVDFWAIGCIMGEICDGQPLFPGDTEVDQLYLIQKTLGKLTTEQQLCFNTNSRFTGLKFPDLSKRDPLEKKYDGVMPSDALSFMIDLLKMIPRERLVGNACLDHPFFDKYNQKKKVATETSSIQGDNSQSSFLNHLSP